MKKNNQTNAIIDDFSRVVDEYFSLEEFKKKLAGGKKLTIKYGVDVTAPFLHLGHAVNLWLMRRLQEAGHKVIFLIGDFTTKIGDPTGRSETRPTLTDEEISNNLKDFIKQISSILITDQPELFEVRKNSEWYGPLRLEKFLSLLSMVTHSRLISRDMFQKRIKEKKEIYMHELIYPILQGYDSVMLESDITIVGSDQLFNEMTGRFFQGKFNQEPQIIITTQITPGLDGKHKQSKSLDNYIALADLPRDKFGKIMSLPDELIIQWMQVYTDITLNQIETYRADLKKGKINPRDKKMELAKKIVERYHGRDAAKREEEWFLKTFSSGEFPIDSVTLKLSAGDYNLLELLKLCLPSESGSSLDRLIKQGAIELDNEKMIDTKTKVTLKIGTTHQVKVGKKRFFKLMAN